MLTSSWPESRPLSSPLNWHLGVDSIGDHLDGLRASLSATPCVFAPQEDDAHVRWFVHLSEHGHAASR